MKLVVICSIYITCFHVFVDAMYYGEYRSVKDYPYMVQLYHHYEGIEPWNYCGAAILSEYWVVSAAYCVGYKGQSKTQVRIGSSTTLANGILIDIEKIFIHGDYNPDFAWDNDITLIKLNSPIDFNEYQLPIQISKETPKIGENINLLGFGYHNYRVYEDSLRVAQTSIIEDKDCFESYEQKYSTNMICTSTKYMGLCFGDSGSPAVLNNKLIGVVSQGCEYKKPDILTKVANYYEWILQTTGIKYME